MAALNAQIDRVLPDVVALRHDLHAHPELGFDVERTADRVAEVLGSLDGFDVRTGVGKTGVVATLNRKSSGPTVALRADMDALPIDEKTGCEYASTVPGRMHACGHDGHTSCLLGTAMVLSRWVEDLSGPVRFIFQPAEETDGDEGARGHGPGGPAQSGRAEAAASEPRPSVPDVPQGRGA